MPRSAIEQTPGAADRLHLKYAALFVPPCLIALFFVPGIHHAILAFDQSCALSLNSLLGRNRAFDLPVAWLNTKPGDLVVYLSYMAFFIWHIFRVPQSKERLDRLSFWMWAAVVFVLIYAFQYYFEGVFSRSSPGKILRDQWFDVRKVYGVAAKVADNRTFPSGHATAYFFFAFIAIRRYRLAGSLLLLVATLLMVTRMITGGHWFSDVFLGSVPITAVGATLAIETGFWKLKHVIEKGLWDVWFVTTTRHLRSIPERARAGWREFLSEEPANAGKK